jgi:serine/threonine-protein kinase
MGEVYRARDTRLKRDVALKVLPEEIATDRNRLARFTREAQLLAALNHPNIGGIHGLEQAGDTRALVLEYVDGPTLAERIARGPIPMDEALQIGREIADALEAAHEQGIIHRDIKPANIKLRQDGRVKVLDFGLAKAREQLDADAGPGLGALSQSPTLSSPAVTGIGVILGTAAYMSPEQARGRPSDKRTDVWAFGCVLYEMLTGSPLFAAATVTDTLAAVVSGPIDFNRVPRSVRRLLAACLERDPRQRLRDIGDGWRLLDHPASDDSVHRPRVLALVAVGAVLLVPVAALLWAVKGDRAAPAPVSRFDIIPPAGSMLDLAERPAVAIAPDGSTLAFVAVNGGISRLFIRKQNDAEAQVVPGSEGATHPVFSPDGRALALFVDTSLKRYTNGSLTSVANIPASTGTRGLTWLNDSTLIYPPGNASGLVQASVGGGAPRPVSTVNRAKGERTHRWPFALPGGKVVLFTVGTQDSPDDYDAAAIDAVVVETGERRRVLHDASMAVYVPTGHLVFSRGGSLYAVGFHPDTLTTREPPQLVEQGVATDRTTGGAHFSIAADGTLAYASSAAATGDRRLVWADRRGGFEPLPLPAGSYGDPQLSPDGTRLVVTVETSAAKDIWLYTFATKAFTRFTFGGRNWTPLWSADGKTLFYVAIEAGLRTTLLQRPVDGSAEPERLARIDGEAYLTSIRDRTALFLFRDPEDKDRQNFHLVTLDLLAGGNLTALTIPLSTAGVLSPDGRFMAYVNAEGGRPQIYVADFPDLRGRWQVSAAGGEEPHWSATGNELFYRYNDQLMSSRIETAGAFSASTPVALLKSIYNLRSDDAQFQCGGEGRPLPDDPAGQGRRRHHTIAHRAQLDGGTEAAYSLALRFVAGLASWTVPARSASARLN